MGIYTKFGDNGFTHTADNMVVPKESCVIEANGAIDELNCHIGLIRTRVSTGEISQWMFSSRFRDGSLDYDKTINLLSVIQKKLFEIGSILSCQNCSSVYEKYMFLSDEDILQLEINIDECEQILRPLTNFVLPYGNELVCQIHIARTVCRRAERAIQPIFDFTNLPKNTDNKISHVQYLKVRKQFDLCRRYMNRLSDWLFVFARCAAHCSNCGEYCWEGSKSV